MKRTIAILGSTGSIGTQALDIIRENADRFALYAITGRNNADLLIAQAREFQPEIVVVANEEHYLRIRQALRDLPIKVWCGAEAIADAASSSEVDIVLTAMVGYAGLYPTMRAIDAGKTIALANKETLVVAGALIREAAQGSGATIIPVDSEHSAIFQCLIGDHNRIEKILLTASGGPFLYTPAEALREVSPAEALRHPNWNMGAKVTVDSASLMNKGFEMIEAHWLFGVSPSQIEVLVHPESVVHSMVQFEDGSVKAQLGIPDMRLPIGYALGLTERIPNDYPRVDFLRRPLSFLEPDTSRFPNLSLAYEAIQRGGTTPCALNAANEIVVEAFLKKKIPFHKMSVLLEDVMQRHSYHGGSPDLEVLVAVDAEARKLAKERLLTGDF